MKRVKLAIIGCGTIANLQHIPALETISDAEVVYCCDIIPERADKAAQRLHAKAVYDYHEILKDETVEGVMVCTPNYLHAPISIDCLKSGKNVFCEKPITVNYSKACDMMKTAREQNKILNIGVCNRFNTTVNKIKELIDKGDLGKIYHTVCSFRSYRSIPGLGGPFTTKEFAGGGVLIDWGVHFLDLILYCVGLPEVLSVSADAYCELGKSIPDYKYINMWAGPPVLDGVCDVEEYVTGHIRTTGPSINFNGAWAQNIGKDEMYIDFLGTKGGIRMDYWGNFTYWHEMGKTLVCTVPDYEKVNMYREETLEFLNCIRTGKKGRADVENVIGTALVMDRIYESAKQKQELLIEERAR